MKTEVITALQQRYNFITSSLALKKSMQHPALLDRVPIPHLVTLIDEYRAPYDPDEFIHYLNQKLITETNNQLIAQQAFVVQWLKRLTPEKKSRRSLCICM